MCVFCAQYKKIIFFWLLAASRGKMWIHKKQGPLNPTFVQLESESREIRYQFLALELSRRWRHCRRNQIQRSRQQILRLKLGGQ